MSAVRGKPCVIDGVQLRSRVERQWCVFFNYLDIRWDYEHRRYTIPGGSYLPDFWLPDLLRFVEIKGRIDQDNIWKAQAFQKMVVPLVCEMDIFIMRVESQNQNYLREIFPGDVDWAVQMVRQMPKGKPCFKCDEAGEIPCGKCSGSGVWECPYHLHCDHDGPCYGCDGTGSWECRYCAGRGGFGPLFGQRWRP